MKNWLTNLGYIIIETLGTVSFVLIIFLIILLATAQAVFGQPVGSPQRDPINIDRIENLGDGRAQIFWSGGVPPFKLQAVTGNASKLWVDASFHIYNYTAIVPVAADSNVYYRVRSIPDNVAPALPSGFKLTEVGPNHVLISWDPIHFSGDNNGGTGLQFIDIYRDGERIQRIPHPTNGFVDSTVQRGIYYSYTIKAVDYAGNQSEYAAPILIRTEPYYVTVAWDANPPEENVIGYRLYWGYRSRDYADVIDVGLTLSYTLAPLEYGRRYFLAVSAVNEAGEGPLSNEVVHSVGEFVRIP